MAPAAAISTARPLVHPAAESQGDARGTYPLLVLRTALERAGYPATLNAYPIPAPQERVLRLIESGDVDVGWSMASADRETRLALVPFPIDRGLLGWRLLLTRREALGQFESVDGLPSLARLRVGQGHDWPDRRILEANGLPTTGAVGYDSLFTMLQLGRVDYLARAANEAESERAQHPRLHLAVVPNLVLHYRTALVFYVGKNDIELRDALTRGLNAMEADGSLEALFRQTYGNDLATLAARHPHRIELHNPIAARGLDASPESAWWAP